MTPTDSSNTRDFRPPAMPLVTVDPYFCVWSFNNRLSEDWTRHWTGVNNPMCGMAYIDGKAFRFAGKEPKDAPAMEQLSAVIHPTRSIYTFKSEGVELKVTFMTPLLMDDLDIMSRPASYVEFEAKSVDGKQHQVSIYFDVSCEWTVNTTDQKVEWGRARLGGEQPLQVLRMGTLEQPVLERAGDGVRIDWGYLYLPYEDVEGNDGVIATQAPSRAAFVKTGKVLDSDNMRMPRVADDGYPVMAVSLQLGSVGETSVSKYISLVYDDQFSIEYFHRKMRPYWRRNRMEIDKLIRIAMQEYPELLKRCEAFDAELVADAIKCGGEDYADVITASYRQAVAAHKLVADYDGKPLFFSKENFSNGCIATVDVTYPSSPIFFLFNPILLQAMIEPIFEYASSPRWTPNFAPHDLGCYPHANGQVYGGEGTDFSFQMPVEESGNMIILLGVLSKHLNDVSFAKKYWKTVTEWAEYLKDKGLDPENQLCTDDFAGHLAHNTNLSLKAITALACYSFMADMVGEKEVAADYRKTAEEMAKQWKEMAIDGDRFKLAFDQPGTWSMKYNLVWDKILNLNLFDPEIAKMEVESYKKLNNPYGLPLDSRQTYTKGDWLAWCAALADKDEDFQELISPLRKYLHETTSRVPFCDWHWTLDGKMKNMQARPVVGGTFMKMLTYPEVWKKWSSRAKKD